MSNVLFKIGQRIGGVDYPAGLLVVGATSQFKTQAMEGGGAVPGTAVGLLTRDPDTGKVYDGAGEVPGLTAAAVSVDGKILSAGVDLAPSLLVVSDSIQGMLVDAPRAGTVFGATQAKGSYYDSGTGARTVGVTNVYAESPCRLKFRAAHNLVTGDQVLMYALPSNHPLACRRYTVTVTTTDECTLDGINATAMPTVTSAGASTDAMAFVDMAFSNTSPLPWMLQELETNFEPIDGVMRPGATSAQLAAVIGSQWPAGPYTHGILHCGRNDAAYDEASLTTLRDAMLSRCGSVLVCLTYPDGVTNGAVYPSATGGFNQAALDKIKAISAFWYAQQDTYPQLRVCDLFGVISNPLYALEAAVWTPQLLASDGTHPSAMGAMLMGQKMAADFPPITPKRQALARVGSGSANLLTAARFTGAAGTLGGSAGITGSCATSWIVNNRSGANVTGGYGMVCRTPAVLRLNGAVVDAGDILDPGDGWWYIVKTGGTLDTSLPAGYATAALYDFATGVTDGTANVFRIPQFQASRNRVEHQYLDFRLSADGGNEYGTFYQSIALPGSVAVGDYVRGQMDVVQLSGMTKAIALRLTASSSVPTQLARAHGPGVNGLTTFMPAYVRKPRTMRTPKLRVPNATATLELRLVPFLHLGGGPLLVSLPVLEKTTAPGQIA